MKRPNEQLLSKVNTGGYKTYIPNTFSIAAPVRNISLFYVHDKFDLLSQCGWKFGASNTVGMYHDFEFIKVLLHL